MTIKAGDVVMLKSGGPALTVAEVNDENAECIWIGDEGELFREALPLIALEPAIFAPEHDEDDENGEDEEDDDDEEEDEELKRDVA